MPKAGYVHTSQASNTQDRSSKPTIIMSVLSYHANAVCQRQVCASQPPIW